MFLLLLIESCVPRVAEIYMSICSHTLNILYMQGGYPVAETYMPFIFKWYKYTYYPDHPL
jgi:hypothetical protein